MVTRLLHAAAVLDLLLVGVPAVARAQVVILPNCNLQEVNLAPCVGVAAGGGGNVSAACCSSLNGALDAGHRCVCSLLLSNAVLASLVANLLTLPLLLPLPGCVLYAPSLAACHAAAASAAAIPGVPVAGEALPTPAQAAATTPPPAIKSADDSAGNGAAEAPGSREAERVWRSNARRRRSGRGHGAAYTLTLATLVIAFLFDCIAGS